MKKFVAAIQACSVDWRRYQSARCRLITSKNAAQISQNEREGPPGHRDELFL